MLEGKNLTFIRADRMQGTGKNGRPYDFANVTLSDGLESFKIDIKPEMTERPEVYNLKKGDKVDIKVDIYENFNRTAFIVSDIKYVTNAKVG